MEFNIAANTVFYISIFVIPGILLRRFYYHGEFHKEFSQGNLLERLMWTIFSSIVAILASAGVFLLIRNFFGNLLPAISYSTLKEIFDLLASNELPDGTRFKEIYSDFLFLIFGVYLVSSLLGFIVHKIVISLSTSSVINLFKFKNYWYYFFRGRVKNTPKAKGKKYWYTEADILVDQDGRSKMFSGKVSDYYVDSINNQLESIFLEDIKRYKFDKDSTNYELVDIPGHVFCVPYSRVLNMNLTYVMRSKGVSIWKKILWGLAQFLYFLILFILFSIFWIEEVPGIDFQSIWYKAWFSLNTWVIASILRSFIRKSLYSEERKEDFPFEYIAGVLFFGAQYLWIIWDRTPLSVIIISFIALIIIIGSLEESDKKKKNGGKDENQNPKTKKLEEKN